MYKIACLYSLYALYLQMVRVLQLFAKEALGERCDQGDLKDESDETFA